jgi:single-stranded-DNA-specific exonuclease
MRAFDLVTTNDYAHAQTVARELVALNTERKKTQREIMDDVLNTIGSDPDQIILVTGHWPQGITGLLATRLMQTYQRPAIVGAYVHESDQTIVKCSGRAPEHMDISATLDTIRHHFLGSGGHPQACGFSFRAENESTVRTALHTVSPVLTGTPPNTTAHADIVLDLSEITQELYTQLLKIGPFGKGNPEPIFESTGYLTDLRLFENVVKLTLAAGGRGSLGVDMVWFFASSEEKAWLTQQPGNMLRIHYTLGLNVWRGRITVQPIVRCVFEETESTKKGPLKRPPDEH